jgi:hypothetical protein
MIKSVSARGMTTRIDGTCPIMFTDDGGGGPSDPGPSDPDCDPFDPNCNGNDDGTCDSSDPNCDQSCDSSDPNCPQQNDNSAGLCPASDGSSNGTPFSGGTDPVDPSDPLPSFSRRLFGRTGFGRAHSMLGEPGSKNSSSQSGSSNSCSQPSVPPPPSPSLSTTDKICGAIAAGTLWATAVVTPLAAPATAVPSVITGGSTVVETGVVTLGATFAWPAAVLGLGLAGIGALCF